jgi:hypothetical protein
VLFVSFLFSQYRASKREETITSSSIHQLLLALNMQEQEVDIQTSTNIAKASCRRKEQEHDVESAEWLMLIECDGELYSAASARAQLEAVARVSSLRQYLLTGSCG